MSSKLSTIIQSATDMGCLALNYLGAKITQDEALEKKFSPAEEARLLKWYSLSTDMGDIDLPTAEGFSSYMASRFRNIDNFSSIIVPGGKSIVDKLSASTDQPAASDVKNNIETALALTISSNEAITQFKQDLVKLEKAIKDPDAEYASEHLIRYLNELKQTAISIITTQHAQEIKNIEMRCVSNSDFTFFQMST